MGVKIVKKLYHSSKISASISLNEYRSLYSKTLKIRSLNSLPPTEGALKKHVERVYFQCQLWHGCAVDPCNWDWKRKPRGKYIRANIFRRSINSCYLLKNTFCSCKNNCTNRCGCRKLGLKCNKFCKHCKGDGWLNSKYVEDIMPAEICTEDPEILEVEVEPTT